MDYMTSDIFCKKCGGLIQQDIETGDYHHSFFKDVERCGKAKLA